MHFRRLTISLIAACLFFPACASADDAGGAAGRPNVVLIIGDDHAWTDYGFMGNADVRTPNIDRLAAEGLTFTRGYVTTALCSPSLATLLTGLHPHQHGITGNDPAAGKPRDAWLERFFRHPMLPRLLAEQGYLTMHTGKYWLRQPADAGFTRDMGQTDRHGGKALAIGRETMQPIRDAIDAAAKGSQPFFIWYAPFLPHTPHNPPQRLLDHYAGVEPKPRAAYYAMIEWLDETVGELMADLARRGIADDTLVVYLNDNGWNEFGKLSPYENGVRTPIVLRWPKKVPARMDREHLAGNIDIMPTILAAAGAAVPADLPGVNLLDDRAVAVRDTLFLANYDHDMAAADDPAKSLRSRTCIHGTWKLIDWRDGDEQPTGAHPAPGRKNPDAHVELFDLAADPAEQENRAEREPAVVGDLKKRLEAWWNPPAPSTAAAEPSPPNVLFILCDDLRPDAVGCYGSPHVKTPHIDALASDGVRFANAFCTTSLCSPSRASILTGLYAHAHGVRNNFTELPPALPHWPGRLRDRGYATAYVGKWHMGEDNDAPRPGFDFFVSHKGQGKYFDTEWNVNGQRRETPQGYYTNVVTDYSLDWLERLPRGKPWALCLGHKAPHSFYFPEPKYAHAFDGVPVAYPQSAFQLDGKPDWIRQRLTTWHGIYGPLFEWRKKFPDTRPEAVKDFENMVHAYWGTILSVDDSVGRLVEFLRSSGQLDNTVIVFMGDNGLLEGEHGMVDKRTMHEPSIRIPIIARGPGLPAGKVVSEQVLTEDIAPSVLDLCQAPALEKIDGRSWVRLCAEGDPDWRTAWLYEYNYEKQFPYTPNIRGIRTDRWKFMHYPHGDGSPDRHLPELYDLEADPAELVNLAADPDHATTRADLEKQLAALMASSGLTDGNDSMPIDEGIKSALPDAKNR